MTGQVAPVKSGYNERLFSGKGLRSYLHTSRFRWFKETLEGIGLAEYQVIEVGCFDGRLLDYIPKPPTLYEGLDAGWEGGLQAAQAKYEGHTHWRFQKALEPADLEQFGSGSFNVAAAMETIEHIPPDLVDGYLEQLARVTKGYLLVTVPNEKGPMFLSKWLAKRVVLRSAQDYRFWEVVAATRGQMHKIERNEHKGFDYDALVAQIGEHFDIVKVEGIPFQALPRSASFTVGILAKSKGF